MTGTDEHIVWFESKIISSLRPRGDEVKAFISDSDSRSNIANFCSNEDNRCLYVYQLQSGLLLSSLSTPEETNISRCMTFVKLGLSSKLNQANWTNNIAFFDNSVDVLENINWLSRDLYLPTVTNEDHQASHQGAAASKKPAIIGDKYVDLMHRFLASSEFSQVLKKGDVSLPYPSIEVLQDIKSQSKRNKSITHVIETTVINWTKQLKVLLKIEPIDELQRVSREIPVEGHAGIPCVVHEEALWHERVISLRKIQSQLHSETTRDLVAYLEQQNNKYATGVHEMRNELKKAVDEALDNIRFLKPLQRWLEEISVSNSVDQVGKLFRPLVHTMQLMWEYSGHYHKKTFFHNLVSLVANQVTLKACSFVNSNLLEDTKMAFEDLKYALNLCGAFRGVYLDTKTKTDALNESRFKETKKEELRTPKTPYYRAKVYPPSEKYDLWLNLSDHSLWTDSPWPEKNASPFDKLNSFSERCNDLLDFVETIHQFRLMRKVAEVGGAGSHGLDALVSEIHEQFEKAMKSFTVSHNDLLGLKSLGSGGSQVVPSAAASGSSLIVSEPKASFEQQFFRFRLVIRDLEKRLAAVLSHSFQQCRTIGSQLRILEVFEGVNNREVIQKAIETEDRFLMRCFLEEMMSVKDMLDRHRHTGLVPEHVNVPLIVSKLKWQHALHMRIEVPMTKLLKVSPNSVQSEIGSQIEQLYSELTVKLEKFKDKLLKDWQRGLNPEIKERLKDFILVTPVNEDHPDTHPDSAPGSRAMLVADSHLRDSPHATTVRAPTSVTDLTEILRVNLDQSLLLLLREVHYLSQPPFEVRMPDTVKEIIRSMDFQTLRSLSARLEAIVAKYNYIMRSITPEERALFHRKLNIIEQLLDQGKTAYTWKMAETQDFIEHASQLVLNDLYYNLDKVKGNLKEIFDIFTLWSDGPLDIFHDRDPSYSYSMQELMDDQGAIVSEHDAYLRSSGMKVHSLLEDTFECVEVSRGSPAWEEYLKNVDYFALKGLFDATFASLRHMYNELADANNSEPKGEPLLVIKLALVDGRLGFKPPLDESSDERSVQETAEEWMTQFLNRGSYIQPIYAQPGSGGHDTADVGDEEDISEYHKRIANDVKINDYIDKIRSIVEANCQDCKSLMVPFNDFYFLWTDDIPTVFQNFLDGKLQPYPLREEVKGFLSDQATAAKSSRSEKTGSESSHTRSKLSKDRSSAPGFYTAKKMTDRIFEHMPSLDAFETEIEIYKLARMRIEEFDDTTSVGWLKVDLCPIKEVLKGYANKAIWTYTDYLILQVSSVLTSLDSFLRRIEPALEQVTGTESSFDEIMRIMHIFNEVSSQHAELDSKFTAMQRTVSLVKKHGLGNQGSELPKEVQKAFSTAPQRWNMLKSKVSLAKQRLTPTIHNQSDFITGKLHEFGRELTELESEITASIVYQRNCPSSSAFELINQFNQKLAELNLRAQDLYELQELLQIPAVDFKVLNRRVMPDMKSYTARVKKELDNLWSIWDMGEKVSEWKRHWMETCWFSMDTKEVAQSATLLETQLAQYPEPCQNWDITESLIESVTMIKAVLPLVEDLSSSAMRARHWKQLYRETKSAIQIDQDTLRYMTLGKLLNTNLHVYAEDIRKIVSRAQGDVTIEQMLKRLEEIWLGKVFTMKEHVKSAMQEQQKDFLEAPEDEAEPDTTSRRSSRRASRDKVMSIAAPGDDATSLGGGAVARSRASSARLVTPGRARRISLSSLPMEIANVQTEFNLDQLVAQMLDKPASTLSQVFSHVRDKPAEYSHKMFLLDKCEEVFEKLESHQVELERMRHNKDAGSFLDEIIKWQSILQDIESVVKVWLKAQDMWLKLDEIFAKSEIATVLPKEAILFSSLNKNFRTLMRATAHKPNILQCCFYKGIRKTLEKMFDNFEFCHSSLLRNLEKRKSRFSRFYFLSDDDVITLIAVGSDLYEASGYVHKVYENIGSLTFDLSDGQSSDVIEGANDVNSGGAKYFRITHINSHMGEPLQLNSPIVCKGETEKWLNDISRETKSTLISWLRTALETVTLDYWRQDRDSVISGVIKESSNQSQQKALKDSTNQDGVSRDGLPQIQIAMDEQNEARNESKTYVQIPNEMIHLAMSCDLTSRAKTAMERKNAKNLINLVSDLQKALDKISQLIISLEDIKTRQQNDVDIDDTTLDQMDVLQSAFHGEPEIEATATMTELIQLEGEMSEDPQPTQLADEQMPRKVTSQLSEAVADDELAEKSEKELVHEVEASKADIEMSDRQSPPMKSATNSQKDRKSRNENEYLNELLSEKPEDEEKTVPTEGVEQSVDKKEPVDGIQEAVEFAENVLNSEGGFADEVNEDDDVNKSKSAAEKLVEETTEAEIADEEANTDKSDVTADVGPPPPRTSSVHRYTRRDASMMNKYYEMALKPYQLKKLENVINVLITWRDRIQRALDSASQSQSLLFSFYWQQMLKFYSEPLNAINPVKIECFGETVGDYQFEYQGSSVQRAASGQSEKTLVNMALSVAHFHPTIIAAPSGSSKRETVRELSRTFGQALFPLTCTHFTTAQTIESVLKGVALSGLWVTIHNVNHLRSSLVVLLGKMIYSLIDAIKNKKAEMDLKPYFYPIKSLNNPGVFCTIDDKVEISSSNPDHSLIRQSSLLALPPAVVSQFRQIALSCPDLKTAYEASLLSKGFYHASTLARKLYILSGCNLDINEKISSSHSFYWVDKFWPGAGWAPVVTEKMLQLAKNNIEDLKSAWKLRNESDFVSEDDLMLLEVQSLAMALKSVFVSKYPGFMGAAIFKDRLLSVMPEAENVPVTLQEQSARFQTENDILATIRENSALSFDRAAYSADKNKAGESSSRNNITIRSEDIEKLGLASSPYFLTRIQQLAEMCSTHHLAIVCGEAGSGKSSVIKCFSSFLETQGHKVVTDRLVVGTLETHELFGYYTHSNRWVDGGFNTLVRSYKVSSGIEVPSDDEVTSRVQPIRCLVLDGVINERQMEIFGSLLHNRGMITFANNESFSLSSDTKIFWEIESLAQLAPSVLTHAPILSINQSELTYKMVTSVWLNKQWIHYRPTLQKFIEIYIPSLLEYSAKMLKGPLQGGTDRVNNQIIIREVIDSVKLIDKVRTMLKLIDGLVGSFRNAGEQILERYFCFSAIWAFGGLFWQENRVMFSEWWHSTFISSPVPIKGTVWDYYIDSETCDWARFDENLPTFSAATQCGISPNSFVHTVAAQQLGNLVGLSQETGAPLMLVGESGCGKTSIVLDKLRGVWNNDVSGIKATKHSANRTNARSIWSVLRENLEWKYGDNFVPKGNKQLLCFIDDINMSEVDSFGNQSACEFIRQHLDCQGVFDPDSMKWRSLSKTQYVTTVNPTLSQHKLSPRFLRHFIIFNCPYPRNSDIHTIFKTLLMSHFLPSDLSPPAHSSMSTYKYNQEKLKMERLLSTCVAVTTEVHNRLRTMFLPTVHRAHYVFTIRDMRTIFTNVCLSVRPNCDRKQVILLWEHENQWVFGRRLIDHVDYDRYQKVFTTSARKEFSNDEDLDSLIEAEESGTTFSSLEETLSGVVIAGPQPGTVTRDGRYHDNYRPFEDVDDVKDVMRESIKEFNKSKPNIRIPLYKSTVDEICRIARMLHSPHNVGHALLVADGSPGLINLIVAMAAHLSNYNLFQIRPSQLAAAAHSSKRPKSTTVGGIGSVGKSEADYTMDHFRSEISIAYKRAGVNNEKIVLMLQLHDSGCEDEILSHLQELVVSGPPVNTLYSQEEQTSIVNSIRSAVVQSGLPYSRRTAWDFFLSNVRHNFRVVLVTSSATTGVTSNSEVKGSPSSAQTSNSTKHLFQQRCIRFPHLTTHMNIVFFHHWKLQQLIEVANYHVEDEDTAHVLANMHLSIRQQDGAEKTSGEYYSLTNTTYEKFIERFVYLRKRRDTEIDTTHERVTQSLRNIAEGKDVILKLKKSLEHERSVLKNQVEGTLALIGQIGQDKAIARQQLMVLYKQHDKLINLRKALPEFRLAYERACYKTDKLHSETVKLVNGLDNGELGELRAMPKPDQEIQDLLAIIIKILKAPNSDSTWSKGAKRQMANLERFKEELLRFEQEPMKRATMETVEPLINKPNFTPDQMTLRANDNKSAGDLTQWVLNVVQYNKLKYEKVRPLKEKVERTGEELREAEGKMVTLESRREALETRLRELAKNYEKATVDKNNQDQATLKMDKQVDEATEFSIVMMHQVGVCENIQTSFEDRKATVCGSVALCAAFAAYLGPYSFEFRARMMLNHWPECLTQRGIPVQFDVIDPLSGRCVEYSFNDEMFMAESEDGDEEDGQLPNINTDEQEEVESKDSNRSPPQVVEQQNPSRSPSNKSRGNSGSETLQKAIENSSGEQNTDEEQAEQQQEGEFEEQFRANESVQNMATPAPTVPEDGDKNEELTNNDASANVETEAPPEPPSNIMMESFKAESSRHPSIQNQDSQMVAEEQQQSPGRISATGRESETRVGSRNQQAPLIKSRHTPSEEEESMGKDALESSSGGDAPKLVLDIEHDFLDRYQLCIKAVVKMLIGENRLNKWLAAGYTLSQIENAGIVMAFGHVRPPLIIDPDGEAEEWIRNSFNNIKLISLNSKDPNSKAIILEALKEGREDEECDEDDEDEVDGQGKEMPASENAGDENGVRNPEGSGKNMEDNDQNVKTEADEENEGSCEPATLVITGVTEPMDSLLKPLIINKNMQREEAKWEEPGLIGFDGHLMVCNEDYSLMMTSCDKGVKFNSAVASMTTLVSYVPNELSLYQKLLAMTFQHLHPMVASERSRVLRGMWRCEDRVRQLESSLYEKLTNFSGDNVWVESGIVKKIVETNYQISQKVEAYKLVLDRQDSLIGRLSPIAERAASLFYLIQNLEILSPNYQFPLASLLEVFREVLVKHGGEKVGERERDNEPMDEGSEMSLHEQFISTKGTRAVESDDEEEDDGSSSSADDSDDEDDDSSLGDGAEEGDSGESEEKKDGDDNEEDEVLFKEPEQVLRLQSADYASQPNNRVKKIVQELTEKLFSSISKCLSPEHRLMFSVFLTLKMKWSEISSEEMFFLFYGNLQERMDSKGLEDFGISSTSTPDWIPKDRFDDIITVSVLQDSPLHGLCRDIVENSDAWLKWYSCENCESVSMPKDDEDSWRDVHRLIVIRLLRPDRFSSALKLFVQDNLPIINVIFTQSDDEENPSSPKQSLAGLLESKSGFVVSLPCTQSSNEDALLSGGGLDHVEYANIEDEIVSRIEKLAESSQDSPKVTVIDPVTEPSTSYVIEFIEKRFTSSEINWVVLKHVSTVDKQFLQRVFGSLVQIVQRTEPDSAHKLWLVGEPKHSFSLPKSLNLCPISYDTVLNKPEFGGDLFDAQNFKPSESELSLKPEFLSRAIKQSVKTLPGETWKQICSNPSVRNPILALCIVNGILIAKQCLSTQGLSRCYSILGQEILQASERHLKTVLNDGEGDQNRRSPSEISAANDDFIEFLVQHVYARMMSSESDLEMACALLRNTFTKGDLKEEVNCLRKYRIPLPPANITELDHVASWFVDKCEWRNASTADYLDVSRDRVNTVARTKNEPFFKWMSKLGAVYFPLSPDALNGGADLENEVNQARMSIDLCYDHLPSLLNVADEEASLFVEPTVLSFPYHPPSRFSSTILSSDGTSGNETLSLLLQQECLFFNEWLCFIRQCLHEIESRLLRGIDSLPPQLQRAAHSLAREEVPLTWLPHSHLPTTHTLYSFLRDLNLRHEQFSSWLKRGVVPSKRTPNAIGWGTVKEIWLGGLVNPENILCYLKSRAANEYECSIDEIALNLEVSTALSYIKLSDSKTAEEGITLIVHSLYLEGSEWGVEESKLRPVCPATPVKMPPIAIRPMRKADYDSRVLSSQQKVYSCPIYTNQSRSCLVAKFDLQCTNEPSVFGLTSTCLLLHGGPQVSLDPSLASRRMRLAHIKSVPKDIPEESHSDIISTSRTKLSKGESLQSLFRSYEQAQQTNNNKDSTRTSIKSKRTNRSQQPPTPVIDLEPVPTDPPVVVYNEVEPATSQTPVKSDVQPTEQTPQPEEEEEQVEQHEQHNIVVENESDVEKSGQDVTSPKTPSQQIDELESQGTEDNPSSDNEKVAFEPLDSDDLLSPSEPIKTTSDFPIASPDTLENPPSSRNSATPTSQIAQSQNPSRKPSLQLLSPQPEAETEQLAFTEDEEDVEDDKMDNNDVTVTEESPSSESDNRDTFRDDKNGDVKVEEAKFDLNKSEEEKSANEEKSAENVEKKSLKSDSRLLEEIINDSQNQMQN
ncbi:dynein beta chain, ciliary-like isoform X3 [Convolutriloba macropyga]|uniref:dynein beta chain, ciliary-like isoform X3 n=1 Tax=Convolutriloba macropyga TaxID=536237 RepID=UPI003F51C084